MKTVVDLTKSKKFDMVGDLFSNYSMISVQIFSYLDFSSLQHGRLVCKSWYHYLTNELILWRDMLMRAKPYLKIVFNRLTDDGEENWETAAAFSQFANEYFLCLKNQKSLNYEQMFKLFGKIQVIMLGVPMLAISRCTMFYGFYSLIYNDLKYHLIGKRLFGEIREETAKNRFVEWFQEHFKYMDNHWNEIEELKMEIRVIDEDYRLYSYMREFLLIVKQTHLVDIQLRKDEIQKHLEAILENLKKQLYLDLEV